jgi:transposase InsO family protein
VNRALIRIIAIKRFITCYTGQIKEKVFNAPQTLLANILKASAILGLEQTLRLLQMPYSQYLNLRRTKCNQSVLDLCVIKHPSQLLKKEVNVIKQYCTDEHYSLWSLSSLYHQIKRDGAAYLSIITYYKYVGLLKLNRWKAKHRRKNHVVGIRATKPFQILHADATIFKLPDNTKAYIYFIQDNFSRMILSYKVALKCSAEFVKENLKEVNEQYIIPNNIIDCQLITDDGSENASVADIYCNNNFIEHLIAQKDIVQSNSMIEAANKQIKYRFLYHQTIATFDELEKYVQLAVDDYNNRPYTALNGLTPKEVMNGKLPANVNYYEQTIQATQHRIIENKKATCCHFVL